MKPRTMVTLWTVCMVAILSVGLAVRASEKTSEHPRATTPLPSSAPVPAASSSPTAQVSPSPASGAVTPCSPSGTTLKLTAKNIAFDTNCLAAPASKAFSIDFANQDSGITHNFAILGSSGKALFTGAIVTGVATTTYHVPALPPGIYRFQCDVHPTVMNGTFVVK